MKRKLHEEPEQHSSTIRGRHSDGVISVTTSGGHRYTEKPETEKGVTYAVAGAHRNFQVAFFEHI